METKFQTSFIPKKPIPSTVGGSMGVPMPPHKRHSSSLFMTIAVFAFILSLLAVGGSYLYKSFLLNQRVAYEKELKVREKQFNVDLIENLKRQNIKIDVANQLLRNHLAVSQIFDIIGQFTSENVRFLSMDLTSPQNQTEDMKISLRGYGTNFVAVAFQSDVLGQLEDYGLRKIVKNPIISDPSKGQDSRVSFGFSASIDPTALSYQRSVSGDEESATSTSESNQ